MGYTALQIIVDRVRNIVGDLGEKFATTHGQQVEAGRVGKQHYEEQTLLQCRLARVEKLVEEYADRQNECGKSYCEQQVATQSKIEFVEKLLSNLVQKHVQWECLHAEQSKSHSGLKEAVENIEKKVLDGDEKQARCEGNQAKLEKSRVEDFAAMQMRVELLEKLFRSAEAERAHIDPPVVALQKHIEEVETRFGGDAAQRSMRWEQIEGEQSSLQRRIDLLEKIPAQNEDRGPHAFLQRRLDAVERRLGESIENKSNLESVQTEQTKLQKEYEACNEIQTALQKRLENIEESLPRATCTSSLQDNDDELVQNLQQKVDMWMEERAALVERVEYLENIIGYSADAQ